MMDADRLQEFLGTLNRARVLCVGDVMLDRFVHGEVERISPEAPIPVVRVEAENEVLGGVGNVARNVAALGGHATLLSIVGDDPVAAEVVGLLEHEPRIDAELLPEANRQLTVKTRFVASGQQLLRADSETDTPISDPVAQALLATFDKVVAGVNAVVVSDYGKGVLTDQVLCHVINTARAQGKTVLVDPKGRDFSRYSGADLITPNQRELADATALGTASEEQVVAAARKVIADCAITKVVVTRSSQGMSIVDANSAENLPVRAREVFDVSGAGDTVIAVLATAIGCGADIDDAAALANLAAGIVVAKVGTAVAYPAEITAALQDPRGVGPAAKLVDLDSARDRAAGWRHQGLRVGFTNGCFDVLHPGHVHLLLQARATCDRLIVGLNSNESVTRLKGPERPVHAADERAMMLGAHGTVDLVVMFDEDTPITLIEALRPDVLIKGADYRLDEVVGAEAVRSWDGEVVLIEHKGGYSTTETLARLRQLQAQ